MFLRIAAWMQSARGAERHGKAANRWGMRENTTLARDLLR
jgi:hypothetical protein